MPAGPRRGDGYVNVLMLGGSVAAQHSGVLFVDQARLMEGSAKNFDDPFHLTIDGSIAFAGNMVRAIRPQQ